MTGASLDFKSNVIPFVSNLKENCSGNRNSFPDRGNSFTFDSEPNEIPFDSNRKENCYVDRITFTLKGKRNLFY